MTMAKGFTEILRPARLAGALWPLARVAVFALTVTVAFPAVAALTAETKQLIEEARRLAQKGDYAAAIIQLKNAVRIDPVNSDARFELAILYLGAGDAAGAQREFETARVHGYDESKIVLPLAQSYLSQGKFQDVLKNFDAKKYSGDISAGILVAQARAHIAMRDTKAARPVIDEALRVSPSLATALAADAILLRFEDKPTEAEAQVDKALSKDPDQSDLLLLKGELRQQQKDIDGAMVYFDKAVQKYPNFPRARITRAMANLGRNKLDAIAEDVNPVLERDPKNQLGLYLRAFLLSRDAKYRDAVLVLQGMPQLLETYPPARYLLAATSFADGQLEVARANAELYASQNRADATGQKLLAAIYQRSNGAQRAVEILEPIVAASPDDRQAALQLADSYLATGKSEQAIKLLQQGVDADPTNSQARLALAVGSIRSGETNAGVSELEKVIRAEPGSLQANSLLILTLLQNKQIDKATEAADALIRANPKDANGYNLKGTVRLAGKDLPGARTAFKAALDKDSKFAAAPLNLARLETQAKDNKAAREWYRKTLLIDAKNLTAFEGLAGLALAENDLDEAASSLEKGIALNPTIPGPRLRLIDMFLNGKDNKRALIAARDYATAAPDDPQAIDALGRAQIANADYTNGIATYQRLTSQLPKNPEFQRRLGRALVAAATDKKVDGAAADAGLLKDAGVALDRAVAMAPDYVSALTDRIALERQFKSGDAALELAHKYVTERPDSVSRLVVAGDLETALQKNSEAAATFRKAWEKSKTSPVLQRLYVALGRSNKADEGLQMLTDWAAKNPTDYDVRFLITSAYINSGKLDEALNETEAMSGDLPENPVLLNNLAWLYSQKKNPKALSVAEKAFQVAPESPDVMDTLGWLRVTNGDLRAGAPLLEKAFGLAPKQPDIAYHYAYALKQGGNVSKAKEVLSPALENKANFMSRKDAEDLMKQLGG